MALLDLFDSRDKKKRLSHIRNLVMIAAADGVIDEDEIELIGNIGAKIGLTHSEIRRIIGRPESISFTPPTSFAERVEQMYDMILLMMIDGEIHDNELDLCILFAKSLGFKITIVDAIIDDIIKMVAKGMAIDYVLKKLENEYL
jgi:hypothetical protein